MKKLTKLTKEQASQMALWAEKWIKLGLSTEPADWESFETGIKACYGYAKIPWHGNVVKVSSPMVAAMAGSVASYHLKNPNSKVQITKESTANWPSYLGGSWWLSWQAYASFFKDVCGLELTGDLWDRHEAYCLTQKSVGWYWPHTDFVIASDRPAEIHLEQVSPAGWGSHRLHCETGPAISWRDGWALWLIHGVRVTKQIVESPETLTAKQILEEANTEVRRIMLNRFGAQRFMEESGSTLVHEDTTGSLYRIDVPNDEAIQMVKVRNSTPEPDGTVKDYWLRVPPTTQKAHEGIAWTFGLLEKEYRPGVET